MNKKRVLIGAAIVAVPVLALGWWLGSPLFIDNQVDEEFPMSQAAEIPDDMTQEQVEAEMVKASESPPVTMEDEMPEAAGPEVVLAGEFRDADNVHQGSGTGTVYRLEDGSAVLRLEDFEVTNGPDLHVLLVPDSNPGSREDVLGYLDLGSLKGNIGDQNYPIPDDVDIGEYGSVVIYCQPFHVIFSVATLG